MRRQLMLVSLLTLVLPWAGCQFVRETESALREAQQQMLSGTALAVADSLSQFPDDFLAAGDARFSTSQVYAHPLERAPVVDGYFDDWPLGTDSLRELRGVHGVNKFVIGRHRQNVFLYVDVRDTDVRYENGDYAKADRIILVTGNGDADSARYVFATEAPGDVTARRIMAGDTITDSRIAARWQDTPKGYRLEARVPRALLGDRLGVEVVNSAETGDVVSRSFDMSEPGNLIETSPLLHSVATGYAERGLRLIITARSGWRLASAGDVTGATNESNSIPVGWQAVLYRLLVEQGESASLAEPDPSGRERQSYVARALNGETTSNWFRSAGTGRAVIAVAQPVWSGTVQTGVLVMQQDTDAILSLTNKSLLRLIALTILATVGAAIALLGYASWLSLRVRRLSHAADHALDTGQPATDLPSGSAADEIGDLSRSFSSLLGQLATYNEYLRTLASKLSHELRTPLAIVRSSLENLDHEPLSDQSREYADRARSGVDRLQKILNAMSEANRVEQLMENAELEQFDLGDVVAATTSAYRDAWPGRRFEFAADSGSHRVSGSPELIVQLLDKLVDNAVDFSKEDDTISIRVSGDDAGVSLSVANPGPPLPETMRHRLFESMVSVREASNTDNLGLGLKIAKLIADGHGGTISGENTAGGVRFVMAIPRDD